MTNETIYNQVKKLNAGNYQNSIFLRPLSLTVDFSITWTVPSDSKLNNGKGYDIYYIKNDIEYVGAVVDMGQRDLHWFITPEHRKKGYLTSAMRSVILPYLFKHREEQRVTFDSTDSKEDLKASSRVAYLIGFRKEGDEYVLSKSDVDLNVDFLPFVPRLPKERHGILMKRLKIIRNEVGIIFEELYMLTDNDAGAEDLKYEVDSVILRLEDLNYDINGDEDEK